MKRLTPFSNSLLGVGGLESQENTPIFSVRGADGASFTSLSLEGYKPDGPDWHLVSPSSYTLLSEILYAHKWLSVVNLKDFSRLVSGREK